jgi:DNA-binding beta-propeller fold protein YncE
VTYQVTDSGGDYTQFTEPSGASVFMPSAVAQAAGGLNKVTYVVKEGKTKEIIGPVSTSESCTGTLSQGCRILTLNYATSTNATGEKPKEWGNYLGQLENVTFTAWNVTTGEMGKPIPVAQYEYDNHGRLRTEWDPRISPALKTTYGYDAEGHVTAVAPSGQQPWLLHYGAIASDPSTGRLLSVIQPAPSSKETLEEQRNKLKEQDAMAAPVYTVKPTLSSTTPVIGTTLSVSSNGTWSNGPLAYSYQWEDCTGSQCTPIAGATNHTYTPQVPDAGYTLVAQVAATNTDGSVVASSAATSAVPISAPKYSLSFGSSGTEAGKVKEPTSTAVDSSGNVWVTDPGNARIDEFSSSGGFIKTLGFGVSNGKAEFEMCTSSCQAGIAGSGNGQFSGPWGIAVNRAAGDVYVSDQANRRVEEFTTAGAFVRTFGVEHLDITAGVGVDPNGNVWVADCGGDDLAEFDASGDYLQSVGSAGSGNGQFSCPGGFAFVGGNMYVADFGNKRIQKFSLAGIYLGQFASVGEPYEINENSVTGEIYESDFAGKVDEFNQAGTLVGSFGTKGIGNGQFEHPTGLAVNSSGDIYVVDASNNRLQEWTPTYSTNNPPPAPPSGGTYSISTIEYNVHVSGTGAPYTLSKVESEKWGQKDAPEEATAIFPPDETQGWPAEDTKYKRATVYYFDSSGRLVNEASPGGAIATTQYEAYDNPEWTLTPGNRQRALEAGSESATVAKSLYTENKYGEEGMKLESSVGPQHEVKLASGTVAQARAHTVYHYDEGAPSKGGPYRLVTTTTEGALLANGEEPKADIRTVKTSYSGQSGLGWELHKPTSVTTEPETGKTLTRTTVYSSTTGNVTEAKSPAAGAGNELPPVYASAFGSLGGGGGQFYGPWDDAFDSHGNLWVSDRYNDRIEELSPSGTFMLAVGWGVKDGKAEAETCTSSCLAGLSGSGNGEFAAPFGIAVNQTTGNVYVEDATNNRIEELTSAGVFVATIGSSGTGAGQFSTPEGLTIDSSGNVWVADTGNNRIEELSSTGTFMLVVGWGVKDGKSEAETCTATCQVGIAGSGNGQLYQPTAIAFSGGNAYVTDFSNARVEEFSSSGAYVSKFGSGGTGPGQFEGPYGIGVDPTTGNLYVADSSNNRLQKFTATGTFLAAFGSEGSGNGQLNLPTGVAVNPSGAIYVVDHRNERIAEWKPQNVKVHDTETIYYSSGVNATYPECGKHPEWQNLPCMSQPAAQPEGSLPKIPATVVTYNVWDEPVTMTETSGSSHRTSTEVYDQAGRVTESEVTATTGRTVPGLTYKYSEETGALISQSSTTSGKTEELKRNYNTLGQLVSYTDASGKTTTYEYENGGDDRPTGVSTGVGTDSYKYDGTTGALKELTDSGAGTFSAEYNAEGQLATETYPNGMKATQTYSPIGQTTALVYAKGSKVWYKDEAISSIHGQWLQQTSTLSHEIYSYDGVGRMSEVRETPSGKGCTADLYSYDADSNRLGEIKRESGNETCVTEGGTATSHSYDEANRLTDNGVTYEPLGENKSLPAADAGGYALESSYYADGALYSQTQNKKTNTYSLDPVGRILETTTVTSTGSEIAVSHYSDDESTPAWIETESGGWNRNIAGIGGVLAATQTNGKEAVIQLANLHGDIIGTVADNPNAESATLTSEPTAFGVPTTPPTSKYSWLGSGGLQTEFTSGVISSSAGSYVPQLGVYLGTTGLDGTPSQDPVNQYLDGEALAAPTSAGSTTLPGAVEPLPVSAQIEAEFWANPPVDKPPVNEPSQPLGGHEGWECTYALQTNQSLPAACGEDPEGHVRAQAGLAVVQCRVEASIARTPTGSGVDFYGAFACDRDFVTAILNLYTGGESDREVLKPQTEQGAAFGGVFSHLFPSVPGKIGSRWSYVCFSFAVPGFSAVSGCTTTGVHI